MRYVAAILAFLVVSCGLAFATTVMIMVMLPMVKWDGLAWVLLAVPGVILGILGGLHSARATLRRLDRSEPEALFAWLAASAQYRGWSLSDSTDAVVLMTRVILVEGGYGDQCPILMKTDEGPLPVCYADAALATKALAAMRTEHSTWIASAPEAVRTCPTYFQRGLVVFFESESAVDQYLQYMQDETYCIPIRRVTTAVEGSEDVEAT